MTTTDPREHDLFDQATHVIGSEPWFEALEDAEAIMHGVVTDDDREGAV